MKKVFLVLHIEKDGVVVGSIRAFTSFADARSCCDALNDFRYRYDNHCPFIVESVPLEDSFGLDC